jgi:hypothetical protein
MIVLLRGIHDAGLSSQNTFTPIHKMDQIMNQDLESHPAYAFKANLIRLLGSLSQGHSGNQDKVSISLSMSEMHTRKIQYSVRILMSSAAHLRKFKMYLSSFHRDPSNGAQFG